MLFRVKEILDYLLMPLYFARGRRAWSIGYYTFKKRSISAEIDNAIQSKTRLTAVPGGYGFKLDERVVEYPWVFSRLVQATGQRLLDAGSVLNYGYLLSKDIVAKSDLTIFTLSPEKRNYAREGISYVFGDLRAMYFAPEAFDVVISISTIEHIGLDNSKFHQEKVAFREMRDGTHLNAVEEYKRVLKKGGKCLLTVPFGKQAVKEWYQIFDYTMVQEIISAFDPASYELCFYGYSIDGWSQCDYQELAEADFFDVELESKEAQDGAAGSRGIACLELIK